MSRRGKKTAEKEKLHPEYRIVSIELVSDMDDLIQKLIKRITDEFSEVTYYHGEPSYSRYYFYKDISMKPDSLFAVLLTTKGKLHVRIGVDPDRFRDERKVTKAYKGRFFKKKGEEREFIIDRPEQLDYAIELIKQCY